MNELIDVAQKLGGVSFATLLVLILIGSYYEVWAWGRQLRKCEADYNIRLGEVAADRDTWKAIAFQATGLAEATAHIAKNRVP